MRNIDDICAWSNHYIRRETADFKDKNSRDLWDFIGLWKTSWDVKHFTRLQDWRLRCFPLDYTTFVFFSNSSFISSLIQVQMHSIVDLVWYHVLKNILHSSTHASKWTMVDWSLWSSALFRFDKIFRMKNFYISSFYGISVLQKCRMIRRSFKKCSQVLIRLRRMAEI